MPKLGQLLIRNGWAETADIQSALASQAAAGGRLGTCLLENNVISEDVLVKVLAEQHRLPAAGVEDLRGVAPEVLAVLPAKVALRHQAVPFRAFGTQVHVAMADPKNLAGQDEVTFAVGKRVQFYIAPEIRVLEALERYYGGPPSSRVATLVDRLNRTRYLWGNGGEGKRPGKRSNLRTSATDWELPEVALFSPAPRVPTAPTAPTVPVAREPLHPAREPLHPAREPLPQPLPSRAGEGGLREKPPGRPAPEQRPTVLRLSETERQALFAPEPELAEVADVTEVAEIVVAPAPVAPPPEPEPVAPVPAPPAAPPAPVTTLAEGLVRLEAASEPEEVAAVLLALLTRQEPAGRPAAVFKVFRDHVEGWMGAGPGLDADALQQFRADFTEPSVFLNLREAGSFHLGALPPMAVHQALWRCWPGSEPGTAMLLPIRIRGRLVTVGYAAGAPGSFDLEALLELAAAAALAYEKCIVRRKST